MNKHVSPVLVGILLLLSFCFYVKIGFAITERETHTPTVERDRVTRYKVHKHIYKLKEEDLGAHTLTIRVKESLANGNERVQDVRDIALQVNPEGSCDIPQLEILYPAAGEALYNTITQPSGNEYRSSVKLFDATQFSSFIDFDPYYVPIIRSFSLMQNANIDFWLSASDPNIHSAKIIIFRDDGVLDASDFVEALDFEGLGSNIDLKTRALSAGDYLFALMADVQGTVDQVVAGEYLCWLSTCNNELDIMFNLTMSSEENVIRLNGGTVQNSFFADFRPIAVKASAPGGIKNVRLQVVGLEAELSTFDGVVYYLDPNDQAHADFYRKVIFSNASPTDMDFLVTSNCDATSTTNTALSVQTDLPVAVTLNDSPSQTLELNYGEQAHLDLTLTDPARSLKSLRTVLYPSGTVPSGDALRLASYKSFAAGEVGRYDLYPEAAYAKPLSVDQYDIQSPIIALGGRAPLGDYDLRVIAFDAFGQGSVSGAIPVRILLPTVPPFVAVDTPEYRVPAGEDALLTIKVDHLGPLDRLEIQASGAAANTNIETLDMNNVSQVNLPHLIPALDGAQIGDVINISVTAVDAGGLLSTEMVQVEIGAWGERTITIDNDSRLEDLDDESLRYANIIFTRTTGNASKYTDSNIRFNRLEVGPFTQLYLGEITFNDQGVRETNALGLLELEDTLIVHNNALVVVAPVASLNQGGDITDSAGSHGGDASGSSERLAYGRVKLPKLPGASGGSNIQTLSKTDKKRSAGGGAIEIIAPNIVIDGEIRADGEQDSYSVISGQSHPGAGGSILIRTQQLDGNGMISVVGGTSRTNTSNVRAGAGGRIAIYYSNYGDNSVAVNDGMALNIHSGSNQNNIHSGPGTVFLKRDTQNFGELLVVPSENFSQPEFTTLPSIGRHTISTIESAGTNRYRITVPGTPWSIPDDSLWELGIAGLQVSLDANDPEATLYEVIDNDSNSFIVESPTSLLGLIGNELIGVYRFDNVRLGQQVRLRSNDRLRSSAFDILAISSLENVPDIQSDEDLNLGDYVQTNAQPIIYVGEVTATSMNLNNSDTQVLGSVNVSGTVELLRSDFTVVGTMSTTQGIILNTASSIVSEQLISSGEVDLQDASSITANNLEIQNGFDLLLQTNSSANVSDTLQVDGTLAAATGSQINARNIVANLIQLDGETQTVNLKSTNVQSASILALLNTTVTPYLLDDAQSIYAASIRLSAVGTLLIAADTTVDFSAYLRMSDHIDLYPLCPSGQLPLGSHGGLSVNISADDCAYGRYDIADLPGSSRLENQAENVAGGVIIIEGNIVTINGSLLADAKPVFPASGGSINISADQLTGTGLLSANGEAPSFAAEAGGGGRILIRSNNHSGFSGDYRVNGGISASGIAAAGTILLADGNLNNRHLIFDNNGQTAGLNSTPIVNVGRHTVQTISQTDVNRWEVTIAGTPWVASDTLNNPGLAGRYVSLNAADLNAPLYQIVSNTNSTLIIDSGDALDSNNGNDLIGVHTFERLTVTGGAYADFGQDRVIVNDIANSNIDLTRITASSDSVLE